MRFNRWESTAFPQCPVPFRRPVKSRGRPDAVMSTTRHEIMSPPAFHGPSKGHRTLRKCSAFPTVEPHLQINWFRGKTLLSRKDNSTQTFRRRHRVCLCYHQDPNPGSGILTWFPFDRWRKELHSFNTEFPYLLGSTNPCEQQLDMG